MGETKVTKHESFGMLQFSRTSSTNGQPLFGSSIKFSNTIRMTLSEGELHRDLNYDRFHAAGRLFEVEMSPNQFAELITSMNMGMGVPVTIKWRRDEGAMKAPPVETKRLQFEREFEERIKKITERVERLSKSTQDRLKATGTISKAEREKIAEDIYFLAMEVRSNLPFIASMWNEQMDKTVQEAKSETEAFFHNITAALGIEHLAERLNVVLPQLADQSNHESPTLPQPPHA